MQADLILLQDKSCYFNKKEYVFFHPFVLIFFSVFLKAILELIITRILKKK